MTNTIYIKKENNTYYLIYNDVKEECYIGKNGLTKDKKEGDLKTPIGEFNLGIVFGTHEKKEITMDKTLKYIQINKKLYWVDDPNSKYYNQLVDITKEEKDWNSAEHLIEHTIPYEYAIEINSNPQNIPGKGSAIFLHCKNKNYTAGCIAISPAKMKELLKSINKDTKIVIKDN